MYDTKKEKAVPLDGFGKGMLSGFLLILQNYLMHKSDNESDPPGIQVIHQDDCGILLRIEFHEQICTFPTDTDKTIILFSGGFASLLESLLEIGRKIQHVLQFFSVG